MSERSTHLLLEDMQESMEKIFKFTDGLTRNHFMQDELVVDAVLRNV
jgi:uncharacterized protein with HEPN domain